MDGGLPGYARVNDHRVTDWSELQQQLFENWWDTSIRRHRSPLVFRGLSRADYDLKTSLIRLGATSYQPEEHLLRNFQKYARRDAAQGESVWNWLAFGQHHGLPTRLLDWTYSPYVALHFATENLAEFNKDGVVWCVNYVEATKFLPQKLKQIIDRVGSHIFTISMLEQAAKKLPEFDKLADNPFVTFFDGSIGLHYSCARAKVLDAKQHRTWVRESSRWQV
jgi:hypothetical protein